MPSHSPRQGYSRSDRVSEQLQRDLAQLVRELKDPRLGMVTLLDVVVSKDLAHAKVWFDVLDVEQAKQAEEVLNHAAGFLRHELGRGLKLRITPELKFFYDDTQRRGNELSAIIDQAVAADRLNHPDDEPEQAKPDSSSEK
ncbi:30S ribosome-binding factor RbfA [uncultured Thiothrix sp.]|uniref:30S ribosome-binding factor RbfA n=1 Tax=uncultured Thiothrix sp. TaxID=223185 RepID=UPI00261A9FD6|nr:30S ribosome-binding factor RbfA [uncultured Thiothrix sp.]